MKLVGTAYAASFSRYGVTPEDLLVGAKQGLEEYSEVDLDATEADVIAQIPERIDGKAYKITVTIEEITK